MKIKQASEIFYYNVSPWNWKDCEMNQMWIEEIDDGTDIFRYHAVAFNPRNGKFMVVSNPRGYYDTLQWVRKWCGSFCILP